MYANHPAMAKEWESHTPKGKKLPAHVSDAPRDAAETTQPKAAAVNPLWRLALAKFATSAGISSAQGPTAAPVKAPKTVLPPSSPPPSTGMPPLSAVAAEPLAVGGALANKQGNHLMPSAVPCPAPPVAQPLGPTGDIQHPVAAAQQQRPQMSNPQGGPSMNPIQSFGGLSSTGEVNGNAGLGVQHSPVPHKLARVERWLGL